MIISEILKEASKIENDDERIEFLRKNECLGLKYILQGAFDSSVTFNLPEGAPPYTPSKNPVELSDQLATEIIYFCKNGPGDRMNSFEREVRFTNFIEKIHPKDAQLILKMKDKKLNRTYKGINKTFVKKVWPNMIKR